jgi:hypothetical protein
MLIGSFEEVLVGFTARLPRDAQWCRHVTGVTCRLAEFTR